MCYRDEVAPLHFDSIHVACLCGDNGHGKTALLDAITWALWGTARATVARNGSISAPRMGELVHLGRTDMSVELDFLAKGQRYRVMRRHSIGARGSSSRTTLELQIAASEDSEHFRPISASTVRETNERIIEILNMDFKTFINTAYLSQGQADVFTTSTPTERKKCLAEVLDLSYYQRLSDSAREHGRDTHNQMLKTRTRIDDRSSEAARKPEYQQRLAELSTRISEDTHRAKSLHKQIEGLRIEVQRIRALESEFAAVRQRSQSAQSDVVRLKRRISADEKRISAYQTTIDNTPQILEGFDALQSAQAGLDRLDAALSEKSRLDTQYAALAQSIARQEERLKSERDALQRRISNELEPRAALLPHIRERQASIPLRRAALANQLDAIEKQRTHADSAATQIHALAQENERLMQEMQETRRKFDMLEQGETTCPLCGQQLGEAGKNHLRAEYQRIGVASKKSYSRNLARIDAYKGERKTITKSLASMEAKQRSEDSALAADEANLARDERDSTQAQQALSPTYKELSCKQQALRDKTFAQDERKKLSDLLSDIDVLEYDAEAHRQARIQVNALRRFDAERHALNEAQARLPEVNESLHISRQMLTERLDDINTADKRMSALTQDIDSLPALTDKLTEAEASSKRLDGELRQAEIERGVLENNINRCDELEAQIRSLETDYKRLARDKGIYDELTTAFGKNGIQALVIESAIPQLQDDANELLARITENRMHLKLELDESTSERLEIRIADELGTRDYLTFSGGEAFRINFALRIALSRLLARRSGAPLPVLFIDEGFGSQDRGGQERLTEAIQSIQDEFEKIIVITHIDQMKEAFPVRIEVSKGERGSTFSIV